MHPATTVPSPAAARAPGSPPANSEDLIKEYHELIYSIAYEVRRTYRISHLVDDLYVHGCAGLLEAARRFQPGRGATFKSFAYPRIRGAILDGIRREGWQSRRNHSSYREASRHAETMEAAIAPRSPDAAPLLIGDMDGEFADVPAMDPDDLVDMRVALEHLPALERAVIDRYYFRDRTMQEIGDELGMSKGWVCKVHARALELLKEVLAAGNEGNS